MKIDSAVINILDRSHITGARLVLPERLDRADYTRVNTVLTAAGAKWNRSAAAHIFPGDARETVENLILSGKVVSIKQAFGYFATTPAVLAMLLKNAALTPDLEVLEPSAGCGVIAKAALEAGCRVDCIELRHDAAVALNDSGLYRSVACDDFPTMPIQAIYDRVLMNPPFGNQADLRHVRQAFAWLKPGGRLVSVMAAGVTYRTNRLSVEFRDFVAQNRGTIETIPDNAFRVSGTDVSTVLVTLHKAL